jgi:excisionase family DNA binding protein
VHAVDELFELARYVGVHDGDFVVRGVSDELAAALGYRRRQMLGMSAFDFGFDVSDAQRADVVERLEAGGVVSGRAVPLRGRDGSRVPFDFETRAVHVGELYVTVAVPVLVCARVELELELAGEWLTKSDAARYAHRHRSTLERAIAAGRLEAGGTPGGRLFRRAALDAWLAGGVLACGVHVFVALAALALAALMLGCIAGVDFACDVLEQLAGPQTG